MPVIEISPNSHMILKTISVCVSYHHPELTCFEISRISRTSVNTVRRHIRSLRSLRLIEYQRRGRGLPYTFDVTPRGKVYLTGREDELRIS